MSHDGNNSSLSSEQLRALDSHIVHIEAGPGAGKTRTVVARFRLQASRGHGVGLVSFTNAAVDVARSRCRDQVGLLDAPNFVGTFDQFFHRYVLTPEVHRRYGVAPRYVSSWDELPERLAVVRPANGGAGIRLSRFVRCASGWMADQGRLSRSESLTWGNLTDWSHRKLNEVAGDRIEGFYRSHLYDTSESRTRAVAALEVSPDYLRRLSGRFGEIIIDEFQDCDSTEHQIVAMLRSSGIHVVTVADPDQAIYEFRHTSTGAYEQYRDELPVDQVAQLTTCYRSAAAICKLTSSLRAVGLGDITSDPDHRGGAEEIHIVVGSGAKAGSAARQKLQHYGVGSRDAVVISHRKSDARAVARSGKPAPNGTSRMESLLAPMAELKTSSDPRARLAAVKQIEKFILGQLDWPPGAYDAATRAEQLNYINADSDTLRVAVSRLLVASANWTTAKECSASVRTLLTQFAASTTARLVPTIGNRLVTPPAVWSFWESCSLLQPVTSDEFQLEPSHVHAVKGDEFEGVVLVLSGRSQGESHVLDDWETGRNSEQRRVLYVGASRAGKVLVIVVPASRRDQLVKLMSVGSIPYSLTKA